MSDTIRQQIITAIQGRVAVIDVRSDYNTNIGRNVFLVEANLGKSDPPAVVIWPQPEEAASKYGKQLCVMPVRIEGVSYLSSLNASVVAEKMLGDLIKCIAGGTLAQVTGGLADAVKYTGGGSDEYPDSGDKVVGVSAAFNIEYRYLTGDPYNQS